MFENDLFDRADPGLPPVADRTDDVSSVELAPLPITPPRVPPATQPAVAVVPDADVCAQTWTLPRTEIGLAERWYAHFGRDWAYRPGHGWYVWTGQVWRADDRAMSERTMTATVRAAGRLEPSFINSTDDTVQDGLRAAHRRWARTCEKGAALEGALKRASRFGQVRVPEDQWDADPWALNTPSGIVDLRTGVVSAHDRNARCTRMTAVGYYPAATSPILDRVLAHLGTGDAEIPSFLRRWLGYSATGSTACQSLVYVWGAPASGKSTLISAATTALGGSASTSYSGTLDPGAISSTRHQSGPTPDLHRLVGRRLVSVPEAGHGSLDADLIKRLCGGETITSRALYGDIVEWLPQLKLTLAGNKRVGIPSDDPGMARRFIPVQVDASVAVEKRDPEVVRHLTSSVEGQRAVLAWLVSGAVEWFAGGADLGALRVPAVVAAEQRAYQQAMNPLADWWEEHIIVVTGCPGPTTGVLHESYVIWARKHGVTHVLSPASFGKNLDARGYRAIPATRTIMGDRRNGRYRDGLRIA